MIIYKDLQGCELCTDSYKETTFDDPQLNLVLRRFQAKIVKETESGDYNTGGNPSQEDEQQETDVDVKQGPDICIANNLQKYESFDKKSYGKYLKSYLKKIYVGGPPADKKEALQAAAKYMLTNFNDADFYIGDGADLEGDEPDKPCMIVTLMWDNEEDPGRLASFIMWKDGIEEEKA